MWGSSSQVGFVLIMIIDFELDDKDDDDKTLPEAQRTQGIEFIT